MREIIHKLLHPLLFDNKERILIRDFRKKISSLPKLSVKNSPEKSAENAWLNFRQALRDQIMQSDPRYFLRWPIITYTMFYQGSDAELSALMQSQLWPKWKIGIKESLSGYPFRFKSYIQSSGNLIHHVYLLNQLFQATDARMEDIKSIFEFGGGYGSMARAFNQLGFAGKYLIFDFPEFTILQDFFLKSICRENNINWDDSPLSNVEFLSDLSEISQAFSPDLFLAAWSLSESPISVRENILSRISKPKYIAIAYQHTFQEIDNAAYFKKFMEKNTAYQWRHEPIQHQPGNSFLFGRLS